jgi:hypothetical protein
LWIFHAFAKQALLFFHARIKRFGIHSRFNTFKNLLWCKLTTVCLLDLLRRIFKYFCITAIGCNLVFQITYFACLAARGNNLFSKGNARFNDIAIGNTVKRVVIIIASVIAFKTPISSLGIIGSAIAISGTQMCAVMAGKYVTGNPTCNVWPMK